MLNGYLNLIIYQHGESQFLLTGINGKILEKIIIPHIKHPMIKW